MQGVACSAPGRWRGTGGGCRPGRRRGAFRAGLGEPAAAAATDANPSRLLSGLGHIRLHERIYGKLCLGGGNLTAASWPSIHSLEPAHTAHPRCYPIVRKGRADGKRLFTPQRPAAASSAPPDPPPGSPSARSHCCPSSRPGCMPDRWVARQVYENMFKCELPWVKQYSAPCVAWT